MTGTLNQEGEVGICQTGEKDAENVCKTRDMTCVVRAFQVPLKSFTQIYLSSYSSISLTSLFQWFSVLATH